MSLEKGWRIFKAIRKDVCAGISIGVGRVVDIGEFEDLLDRLGEDLARWPAEKQRSASRLLAESAEARELLRESGALRTLLSAPPLRAPAGLADQIVAEASRQGGGTGKPGRGWFPPSWREGRTLFLSICFLAGILTGVLSSKALGDFPEVGVHDYVAYVLNFAYPVD